MKQCISEQQLGQLTDDKLIEYTKYFKFGEGLTAKWWTIGKIIEVLQGEGIKIKLDNCIPASVWVEDKEYCENDLCDALWKVLIEISKCQ